MERSFSEVNKIITTGKATAENGPLLAVLSSYTNITDAVIHISSTLAGVHLVYNS